MAIEDERLQAERARLIRQCYRLTGSVEAAEDLAQETLYEATRNVHKLHDPAGYGPWLFAIARHVCLRWSATRGRDPSPLPADWEAADSYDLEFELTQGELTRLLDRALALLPPDTRDILIERYVRESPHAEIAAKLGLSAEAVMKRVERGKLRLKRVLSTSLIHDAVSHGLADGLFADWRTTDIWCPICGVRHLLGSIQDDMLWLVCKPCRFLPVSLYATIRVPRGVKGFGAIYLRSAQSHHERFAAGLPPIASCPNCARPIQFEIGTDPYDGTHYAQRTCDCLRHWEFASPWQVLASPRGVAFWQSEERIRVLPERAVDIGVPALVVGFESLTSGHRLEGVLVTETLRLVSVDAAW